MVKQIFVNLPVADLPRSMAFFKALGFSFDPQWTDDTAACMAIGENIYAMLLVREKFQSFTPRPVADPAQSTQVLVALLLESREAVDAMVASAVAHGGSTYKEPEDHGFMYGHGFMDPDGHIWEPFHLIPPAE